MSTRDYQAVDEKRIMVDKALSAVYPSVSAQGLNTQIIYYVLLLLCYEYVSQPVQHALYSALLLTRAHKE